MTERPDTRLPLPDALRGLAALSVAAFHLLKSARHGDLPLVKWGWLGVPAFFVISGFVIPYSMRNANVSWSYSWRYALRRSIRLDPPLWATIVFVLLSNAVIAAVATNPGKHLAWPGLVTILANFAYVQNLLWLPNLSVGLWTLCIEVQFYLSALVLLYFWQHLRPLATLLFVFLTCCSVIWFDHADGSDPRTFWSGYRTLFPQYCLFSLGIAACWVRLGRCRPWIFWSVVTGCCVKLLVEPHPEIAVGLITAILLHKAAGGSWLSHQPLAYLGSRSYSLYLIHAPVGRWIMIVAAKLNISGFWPETICLVAALIAADILYRCVERPSQVLSRRVPL